MGLDAYSLVDVLDNAQIVKTYGIIQILFVDVVTTGGIISLVDAHSLVFVVMFSLTVVVIPIRHPVKDYLNTREYVISLVGGVISSIGVLEVFHVLEIHSLVLV